MSTYSAIEDDRLRLVIAHLRSRWFDPTVGLVAAGIFDGDKYVLATSSAEARGKWHHAENNALQSFLTKFGVPTENAAVVVTLAPCVHDFSQSRLGPSCGKLLSENGLTRIHVGAMEFSTHATPIATYKKMGLILTQSKDRECVEICERLRGVFLSYGTKVNEDLLAIKRQVSPP